MPRRHLLVMAIAAAVLVGPALALEYGRASGDQPFPTPDLPASAFKPVGVPAPRAAISPIAVAPEVLTPAASFVPPRATPRVAAAGPIVVVIPAPKPKPKPRPVVVRAPAGSGTPTVADARAYALARIGSTQYSCLNKLWTRESNWNPYSYNSSSGAYGIPQALPGDKMATFGSDWRTNPVTQVKWGLSYIANRYGTACAAWAHSQNYGWY